MLIFFFFFWFLNTVFFWASFHSSSNYLLKTLKNIEILLALCLCTFSFHQSLIILFFIYLFFIIIINILKISYWDRVSIEFFFYISQLFPMRGALLTTTNWASLIVSLTIFTSTIF